MVALPLLAGTTLITVLGSSYPTLATIAGAELGTSVQARLEATACGEGMVQNIEGSQMSCMGEPVDPPDHQALLDAAFGSDLVEVTDTVGVLTTPDTARRWNVREVDLSALPGVVEATAGRLPTSPGEALIGEPLVAAFGGIGDSLEVVVGENTIAVEIVGTSADLQTLSFAVTEPDSQYLYLAPGTLPSVEYDHRLWFVAGDQPVTWEQVLELNESGFLVTSRDVLLDPPPASAVPFNGVNEDDLRMTAYIGGIAALLLIEVVLLIGPAFAVGARRQARYLAQIAAHGGAPRELRRIVLASGVVTALAGGVIGIALGLLGGVVTYLVLAHTQSALPNLVLPTWELALLLALALLIGLAAAWIPARTASRADVVATLGGRREEATPRRGVARLGVAVAVLGALTAALGALIIQPAVLIGGVVLLEVGIILSAGGAVALLARLAPRVGVAGRFALREAARHRTRTGPAVAAVIAAVAVASTLMVYVASTARADQNAWDPLLAEPTVVVALSRGLTPTSGAQVIGEIADETATEVSFEAMHVVTALKTGDPATGDVAYVDMEPSPDLTCPWEDLTDAERRTDPRCNVTLHSGPFGTIVDDGSLVTALGVVDANAVDALASGGVVVPSDLFVWADGQAHLRIDVMDAASPDAGEVQMMTADAVVADWSDRLGSLIISPEVAEQIGLETVTSGALVVSAQPLTDTEVARIAGAFYEIDEQSQTWRDDPPDPGRDRPMAVALLTATAVALVATGLATGLAGSHIAADLATLLAVGASPRTRRRISAAQAVVIAGTGAILGGLAGMALGGVVVLWERQQGQWPDFPFVVPWQLWALVAVIPVVSAVCGYAFTRSRLPLVRRIAE